MTRSEHIQWCKDRALQEIAFYHDEQEAARNGIVSMMSDLRKHPDADPAGVLQQLCVMEMMRTRTKAAAIKFINGFN